MTMSWQINKNLLDDVVDAIFVVVAVVVQQLQPKLPKNFVTKVVLRLDSVWWPRPRGLK